MDARQFNEPGSNAGANAPGWNLLGDPAPVRLPLKDWQSVA